jgi:superoxide dismutase, Fe-Mn family
MALQLFGTAKSLFHAPRTAHGKHLAERRDPLSRSQRTKREVAPLFSAATRSNFGALPLCAPHFALPVSDRLPQSPLLPLSGSSRLASFRPSSRLVLHLPSRYRAPNPWALEPLQGRISVTFKLPPLPYAYDALAPTMSAETLQFHHDKHHQAYVDNGNKLIAGSPYEKLSLEEICKKAFAEKNAGIVNNAGQHYNHIHFWQWMKKGGGGKKLPGKLEKLVGEIGGYDKVRSDFVQAGITQFGSGWAWLVIKNGKLEVQKTPNGENPLMHGASPILGVDVWEHSYYIDYRNARPKYLEAWFDNLVNWEHVEAMLDKAR